MYRHAELHKAFYSSEYGKSIWYDDGSDDLQIAVVFETKALAMDFQTFLTQLYLNNPTVKQGDIHVREANVVYVAERKRVLLSDYDGDEYEPVTTLEDFTSVQSLSNSSLSVVSCTDPLVQFQTIEKLIPRLKPYRCHIKPNSSLRGNENNMILGNWTFHQYFDGVMTRDESGVPNVPLIAIRPTPNEPLKDEMIGEPPQKRTRVSLLVECRSKDIAKAFGSTLKDGSERVSDDTWKTFVHVQDAETFCDCLNWKYTATNSKWNEIDSDSN